MTSPAGVLFPAHFVWSDYFGFTCYSSIPSSVLPRRTIPFSQIGLVSSTYVFPRRVPGAVIVTAVPVAARRGGVMFLVFFIPTGFLTEGQVVSLLLFKVFL